MKKILVLTTDDFSNPEEVQQQFFKGKLKHGDLMKEERECTHIIFNGKYIKNRTGNLDEKPSL
jgi:hypothetical protein